VYISGGVHVNNEKHLLASSRLSVIRLSFCVFALNSVAATGTIFVKLDIGIFCENVPKNPIFVKIWQKYQATVMTT
jgi:hypothetical protein